jgi:enterochelin esterase-like enzyme
VSGFPARGWLDSVWPAAVCTALFAVAGLVMARTALKGRSPARLAVSIAAVAVAALLAGLAGVNTFAGYVPDGTAAARLAGLVAASTGPAHGEVRRYLLAAPALHVPASAVWVYLPPGYQDSDRRYPVVYLLPGYPGRSVDWFAAGRIDRTMDVLVAEHKLTAIVVTPDMNGGSPFNDTEGLNVRHGPQVQTYLATTVPTWVDHTFRTIADPGERIIGGLSAGGDAALSLGLQYQTVFGAIIAQEPYAEPTHLDAIPFVRSEPTFIDVGSLTRDSVAEHLAQQLRARGQPVDFRTEPGQYHTWTEARAGIAYGLMWTANQLHWRA